MPDSGDLQLDRRSSVGAGLYETDFYAWCLEQGERLRERAGSDQQVDWERLAEEIESLGASDHSACESYLTRILEHLLKIGFLDRSEEVKHHAKEIRAFRKNLRRVMSPSLKAVMPDWVEPLYFDALKEPSAQARQMGLRSPPLPSRCPYTWDDVIGREDGEWVPEPRREAD